MPKDFAERLAWLGGNITERPDGKYQITMSPLLTIRINWNNNESVVISDEGGKFPDDLIKRLNDAYVVAQRQLN